MNFEKHLNLPLYYETEKEDIINAVKEALNKVKEEEFASRKRYSVIDIRNSILKKHSHSLDILEEIE